MKRAAALLLMLLLVGFPLALCLASACDPLYSQRVEPEWLLVLPVEELGCDGVPQRLHVWSEHYDAWTHCEQRSVGTVFVRFAGDERALEVLPVNNSIGCALEYDPDRQRFRSRCHDVEYDVHGKVIDDPQGDFANLDPVEHRIDNSRLFVRLPDRHL